MRTLWPNTKPTETEAGLDDCGESTPDTGSALEFLHESLLTSDPTGAEGQDLFT